MANPIFIYEGGRAPQNIRHARIDESLSAIPDGAFMECPLLLDVELHKGISTLGARSFSQNKRLRWITLPGVREIKNNAFDGCENLEYVEFGNKLDVIRRLGFIRCRSLQCLVMPSVRTIEWRAFYKCPSLVEIKFGVKLERIGNEAFYNCINLRLIAIPLKNDMIEGDPFVLCRNLSTIELVGGIHKTVASLHLEKWRDDMMEEINRINEILPHTDSQGKTSTIQQWIESVIHRIECYKVEHLQLLKEAMALLELALWKVKLFDVDEDMLELNADDGKEGSNGARKEQRITSGASIVIKNVLSFLILPK